LSKTNSLNVYFALTLIRSGVNTRNIFFVCEKKHW